ncbi:hypothetical protein AMTRI_Chr08g205870 [Amborella trichopoda]
MMILTYCPSLLNLEAITAFLSHFPPFHPVLSPICRVSSFLISFYRIHGHPLIPCTAFPIIDKHLPHFHLALNPSFIVGHLIDSGGRPNPSFPQPALYSIPCILCLSSFYEGSCPCFNVPSEPMDLQQPTTGYENLARQDNGVDISFEQSKDRVKFFFKVMGFKFLDSHHQQLLSLDSTSGDNGYRELINLFSSINPKLLYPSSLSSEAAAVNGRVPSQEITHTCSSGSHQPYLNEDLVLEY